MKLLPRGSRWGLKPHDGFRKQQTQRLCQAGSKHSPLAALWQPSPRRRKALLESDPLISTHQTSVVVGTEFDGGVKREGWINVSIHQSWLTHEAAAAVAGPLFTSFRSSCSPEEGRKEPNNLRLDAEKCSHQPQFDSDAQSRNRTPNSFSSFRVFVQAFVWKLVFSSLSCNTRMHDS